MAIAQNDALFNLIGTTYGGDGQTTFGLPDLRGRVPTHQGSGQSFGQSGGAEQVTLTDNQLPAHSHALTATTSLSNQAAPGNNVLAQSATFDAYQTNPGAAAMAPQSISSRRGTRPHSNMKPYQCVNFIISIFGIYPTQT